MSLDAAAAEAGYTLVNLAARGDRSSIYRADDEAGRRVALRVFGSDVEMAELRHRVDALAAVDHANVLSVLEAMELGDEPAVAAEWFDGVTLADELAGPEPMPEVRAERLTGRLFDGLEAIHRAGLAHGSVSLHDVLVDGDALLLVDLSLGLSSTSATAADDISAVGPVVEALFSRTDLPKWRADAIASIGRPDGPADIDALRDALLPSRRERARRERIENEEKQPILLMIAVGLGAALVTLGAFLWLGPDEEPLPGPTITGETTDTGS